MDSLQQSATSTDPSDAERPEDPQTTERPETLSLIEIDKDSPTFIAQGRAEIVVLETLWAEARPLTLEQIRRATALSGPALEAAIGSLRNARMLRALNTLIESYVPSRRASGG
jgi:hypothetical protein